VNNCTHGYSWVWRKGCGLVCSTDIPDIPKPTVRVPERLPRNVFSLPIWWIVRVQELKELKLGGGFNPFEKY